MNKRLTLLSTLVIFLMVQNCTNINKNERNISKIKKNMVILIPRSDTIDLGGNYGTEIHIVDYDSTSSYACFVGNYEIKVNNKDTILQMISRYDSLCPTRIPGIYYLQTKPTITGNLTFTGFIRKTQQGETIYFPFKGSFYVK